MLKQTIQNNNNSILSNRSCFLNSYYLNSNSINVNKANHQTPLITSFKLLNAQHEPLVLSADLDCIVRIFKPDLVSFDDYALVTAFAAFARHERKCSSIQVGCVCEWDERAETLVCAGDASTIRVWDMSKELHRDYVTGASSCVSALSFVDNLAAAGFGDGTVKLFDFRKPSTNSSATLLAAAGATSSTTTSNGFNHHRATGGGNNGQASLTPSYSTPALSMSSSSLFKKKNIYIYMMFIH